MRRQAFGLSVLLFVAASAFAASAGAITIDGLPDSAPVAVTDDAGDADADAEGGVPEGIRPTMTPDNLGCAASPRAAFGRLGAGAPRDILAAIALAILVRRSRRRHAPRSPS